MKKHALVGLLAFSLLVLAIAVVFVLSGAGSDAKPIAPTSTPVASLATQQEVASPSPATPERPQAAVAESGASSATRHLLERMLAMNPDEKALHEMNEIIKRWLATDRAAALRWLDEHPNDERLDPALGFIAQQAVAAGDFEEAQAVVERIRTPLPRERAIEEIYAEGYRHRLVDQQAVRNSGLPAGTIESILNGSRLD